MHRIGIFTDLVIQQADFGVDIGDFIFPQCNLRLDDVKLFQRSFFIARRFTILFVQLIQLLVQLFFLAFQICAALGMCVYKNKNPYQG